MQNCAQNASSNVLKITKTSPIYFVKIQLPGFFYEMNSLHLIILQHTFAICTLSKIMNICCKYNIFLLVDLNLQAIER